MNLSGFISALHSFFMPPSLFLAPSNCVSTYIYWVWGPPTSTLCIRYTIQAQKKKLPTDFTITMALVHPSLLNNVPFLPPLPLLNANPMESIPIPVPVPQEPLEPRFNAATTNNSNFSPMPQQIHWKICILKEGNKNGVASVDSVEVGDVDEVVREEQGKENNSAKDGVAEG